MQPYKDVITTWKAKAARYSARDLKNLPVC